MPFRGHSLAIRTNQKDSSFKDSFLSDDASLPEQRTSLDADKRAHHNALERRRRDHIKFSFTSLRDAVPSLQGEKASRAQILKKAADYIQSMRRKNTAHLQDIEDLKRQNKLLEEQIRALEKTKVAGGGGYSTAPMLDAMNIKGDSISAFDGGSGSESSDDTDNSSRGSRKKLKSSPGSTPLHL
ncbi:protein max-like isoform X6 [Dermacentor albipictus]|uniref:protein max-like isoform X6 n=1 Tax=Dermacentor albipictus TaxID=60249 RepID=UPI0038FC1A07